MTFNVKTISYKDLKTCRYLLKFSYIGTNYQGLQRQTTREEDIDNVDSGSDQSVQYQIETALQRQLRPIYGARLAISSRTDSGVHALANSAHVDLTHPYVNTCYKPSFITESANKYLNKSGQQIRIMSTQMVGNGFNSRNDAKWRSYLYRLAVIQSYDNSSDKSLDSLIPISELNRCHVIRGPLDIEAVKQVVDLFKGRHDFASFTPKPIPLGERLVIPNSVKDILELNFKETNLNSITDMNEENDTKISLFTFEVKCKSFLYNQIRRMIGSIIDVGLKRFPLKHMEWLLQNPSHKHWNESQTVAHSRDLEVFDDLGNKLNSVANYYPNYNEISHFFNE